MSAGDAARPLPLFVSGEVVRGFGRGSRDLGIPTANYAARAVAALPPELEDGVYYGWAQVGGRGAPVHKMVASVGRNPHYRNEARSMETHVLHRFDADFYGSELRVAVVGYVRPERAFAGVAELVAAIMEDVRAAEALLEEPARAEIARCEFFRAAPDA